jgi:Rho-related BTB domain-containing protein 1/2
MHVDVLFIHFQFHNADQLASWCLWFILSRYTQVYYSHSKLLQTLRPENQIYLSKHRWPPLW